MKPRLLRFALVLSIPAASACEPDLAIAPDASSPDLAAASDTPVPVGLTDTGTRFVVDTRAGLTFQVNKANCDIVSLRRQDLELQDLSRLASHIASGLGTGTQVTAATTEDGTVATITCTTPTVTHYYVARGGTSAVFMATHITAEPVWGELRYIFRLKRSALPYGNPSADGLGNVGRVEGSDVFRMASGQTRSKFYSNPPAIDNLVHGVTGPEVGAWIIMGSRESSSGGPFFRDINNQGGSQQELYNYMYSDHTQTEPARMGLHGPYALVVNSGERPSADLDMSWMGELGLKGWVGERGQVTGRVAGMRGGVSDKAPFVVGWANARAQYWARVSPNGGSFTSPPMIPGTYTMTLYKNELAVERSTVRVGTETVTENLRYVDPPEPFIFRIGEFDGTPRGFRNADRIADMHPSDVRMDPWGPLTYTVGESALTDFPMAQFKTNRDRSGSAVPVNDPTTIRFTLGPGEVRARTLRIGITLAFGGGRPVVRVNPGTPEQWVSRTPPSTKRAQPTTRGVTRGTYRGNNMEFTYDIPASAFVAGTNTLEISVASGEGNTGFLAPSVVYDAVQLDR